MSHFPSEVLIFRAEYVGKIHEDIFTGAREELQGEYIGDLRALQELRCGLVPVIVDAYADGVDAPSAHPSDIDGVPSVQPFISEHAHHVGARRIDEFPRFCAFQAVANDILRNLISSGARAAEQTLPGAASSRTRRPNGRPWRKCRFGFRNTCRLEKNAQPSGSTSHQRRPSCTRWNQPVAGKRFFCQPRRIWTNRQDSSCASWPSPVLWLKNRAIPQDFRFCPAMFRLFVGQIRPPEPRLVWAAVANPPGSECREIERNSVRVLER